jgi:hypothetical protein
MSPSKTQAESFKALVAGLREALREPEQFTLSYAAESSVRALQPRPGAPVRSGAAGEHRFEIDQRGRHADCTSPWLATRKSTCSVVRRPATTARNLPLLPQDPYLLLNYNGWQSNNLQEHPLPDTEQVVGNPPRPRVWIWSASTPPAHQPWLRQFAGAFGWHQANSFNFDFSLFHENGQAVKASYAGHDWSSEGFASASSRPASSLRFSAARCAPWRPAVPRLPGASGTGRNHEHALLGRFLGAVDRQQKQPAAKLYGAITRSARWCRWTKSQRLLEPGVLRRRLSAQ